MDKISRSRTGFKDSLRGDGALQRALTMPPGDNAVEASAGGDALGAAAGGFDDASPLASPSPLSPRAPWNRTSYGRRKG